MDPSYFNILVIHQNRYKGHQIGVPLRNSITDDRLPEWLSLVVWGHEHESIPYLRTCEDTGVDFLQPGSTVYTSLIEAESKQKHCFVLRLAHQEVFSSDQDEFEMELDPIPLKSLRPLLYKEIKLSETNINPLEEKRLIAYIQSCIEAEFVRAIHEFPDNTKVPLFRLKIDHSGYPVIAPIKITGKYNETQIANIGKCL